MIDLRCLLHRLRWYPWQDQEDEMPIAFWLWLAKYKWVAGKPPRNGRFLLLLNDGEVKLDYWYFDSPMAESMPVSAWRRVNAPVPAPREYLSYTAESRLSRGEAVPFIVEYR